MESAFAMPMISSAGARSALLVRSALAAAAPAARAKPRKLRSEFVGAVVPSRPAASAWAAPARGLRTDVRAEAAEAKKPEGGRKNVLDIRDESAKAGTSRQKLDLNPPKGTRDWYPEEMRLRSWLFGHFREVSRQFGFEEWDAPVLESEELYVRKAGEEITGQLYNFEDKGGRPVALRPELTPSLARMVMGKGKALPLPLKWFAVGQCWRYERMTRGRKREHYQWNMDIWGVPGVEAEAELLASAVALFKRLGLGPQDVGLRVSSRRALQAVCEQLGVPEERFAAVCVLVDKLEKVPREAIADEMAALGLSPATVDALIEALSYRSLDALEARLGPDSPAVKELRRLFELAEAYGISEWIEFNASIVRGLAYYTGMVFEGFDRGASLRAICGGGRYDRILSMFGGEDVPAVGFGFGDVVVVELLKDKGLLPDFATARVDDLVFAFDEELRPAAVAVASRLRAQGRAVDLVLEPKKVKWAFKQAERVGAARAVLIGSDEWAKRVVKVKDLAAGTEAEVPFDQI